jgi:hypothetical protein
VGDVTAQTQFGVGSKEVSVSSTTTYVLTASRGAESLTKQVDVAAVRGVATGWHWLDTFELLSAGNVSMQSTWLGAEGVFNVSEQAGNKALGYDDGTDLTALKFNSFLIPEGQKGTLSFRVYAVPTPEGEAVRPIGAHIGLTERSIRFNGDFNQNVGPYVRIERLADGATIDIQARNGVATGFYEGQAVDAIQPGSWYRLWIDVDNRPFNLVDGVQNGGDLYSVYIQKEGAASRTTLFENYLADRDAVIIDPALGAPTKDLTHVFISAPDTGQGMGNLLFDDFFISVGAYNSAVPYVPVAGQAEIRVTGSTFDRVNNRFTITWTSEAGTAYSIQRTDSVTGPWNAVATGYPAGGATGSSTSYTDNTTQALGFYRVVFQP